jgi:hypothetical protein
MSQLLYESSDYSNDAEFLFILLPLSGAKVLRPFTAPYSYSALLFASPYHFVYAEFYAFFVLALANCARA